MELNFFIDIVLYALILIVIYYVFNKIFARSNIGIILIVSYLVKVPALFFELRALSSLVDVALISAVISVVISNEQKINKLLKRKKTPKSKQNANVDKKQLYKIINTTVNMLSSAKIGAIMTFEKKNSLDDYIKQGVKVDAPVSSELLTTIFYPGTTLHDGAVVIRGNNIEAASVYYTPTVKALGGKYGARHRASLGISEVCDALTVVVSEETGRISLAVDGELIAVNRENFLQMFKEELEK
jgi:diadenylate cyclase